MRSDSTSSHHHFFNLTHRHPFDGPPFQSIFPGVLFTALLALIGFALSYLPGLERIGPLACAILVAVLYRQILGYPQKLVAGIQFTSKYLLRSAIILFGLKLNITDIVRHGPGVLLRDAIVVVFSIGLTTWLGRKWKADRSLTLLLGIGTGVCGAAAIAAVSPLLGSKDEDTASAVGIVALTGTLFAVGYTLLYPFLPLSTYQYGMWSGLSLHEIAHTALAAAPAGQEAMSAALIAKLGRVMMLIPLSLILWVRIGRKGPQQPGSRITFPYFLLGFLGMSILGTLLAAQGHPITGSTSTVISTVTQILLAMAMVSLGLNVFLAELKSKALRPFLAMLVTSIFLSFLTWIML
ncbi:putative integral membrane protein (TIGR00698 family) [Paenibacillus shirakamiensis]|uniref:Integral membrane protein (TIGR00698 family) n=1 Tax=Paenibacillus shirakamiensis TaxID=1265935 RepID=A0ABS4JJP7_9BACL|nr:putative sulfate exporter family transporter [Paenibacillus shirakamiensis]MBP2001920.1 putative integral membrane protein (TIGR00698 family) [Paenibacillus shirakamiensis]